MATFNPKLSQDDLTELVLKHWHQHHPKRLTGSPKADREAAQQVAAEVLETARVLVEKLSYSNDQAMAEAQRDVLLV